MQSIGVNKMIYPAFSYKIAGLLFETHNELGRYCREKQYGDYLEVLFRRDNVQYVREYALGTTGNIADFIVKSEKQEYILLELKAKTVTTKEDYIQTQRYLQCIDIRLALLVNFRQVYLKPHRIVKIEKTNQNTIR